MATTNYKNENLTSDIQLGTIVLEDLDFESVERGKERRGEGDDAKTIHTMGVLGTAYEYGTKHDRNSDYYRLKNQVERSQKNQTEDA